MTKAYNMKSLKGNTVINQIVTINERDSYKEIDFYSYDSHMIKVFIHKDTKAINVRVNDNINNWTKTTTKYALQFMYDSGLVTLTDMDAKELIKVIKEKAVKNNDFIEIDNISIYAVNNME